MCEALAYVGRVALRLLATPRGKCWCAEKLRDSFVLPQTGAKPAATFREHRDGGVARLEEASIRLGRRPTQESHARLASARTPPTGVSALGAHLRRHSPRVTNSTPHFAFRLSPRAPQELQTLEMSTKFPAHFREMFSHSVSNKARDARQRRLPE